MTQFIMAVGFHILLVSDFYNIPGAIVWTAVCIGAAVYIQRDQVASPKAALRQPVIWWRWTRRSIAHERAYLLVLPPALIILFLTLIRPCIGFDYSSYHGLKAALWVVQGLHYHFDSPSGWTIYKSFPGGGSIALSWAMLLFHSDRLSSIVSFASWPFFVLAAYSLARELQVPSRWAWLLAWFCGTLPNVLYLSGDGNIDIPMHALLMTAFVLVLRGIRTRSSRYFLLQAVAAGLAASMKLPTLPLAFLIVLSPILLAADLSLLALITSLFCGSVVVAGLMLPWYYYNYLGTGYPLSPLSVKLAGVTLGVSPPAADMYLHLPIPSGTFPARDLKALGLVFFSKDTASTGPYILVLLFLSPFGLYRAFRRNWQSALFLLLVLIYCVALYFSHSFQTNRFTYAILGGRFFLSLLALYAILGYPQSARFRAWMNPYLFLVILYDLLYEAFQHYKPEKVTFQPFFGFIPIFLGLMVFMTYKFYQLRGASVRPLGWTFAFVVPVWILALAIFGDKCRAGFINSYDGWFDYFGPAITQVDEPPRSYRIALTTETYPNFNQIIAMPFLGRELQNEITYVPISRSGTIYDDTDPHRADEADFGAWFKRLIDRKIDAVMTFSPRSIEMDWMEAHPSLFQKLHGGTVPMEVGIRWLLTSIPGNAVEGWGLYRVIPVSRLPAPAAAGQ
jgi:4-amino-4-deoxy-L-arabinose transferase-like glycosyltransferase